MATHYFVVSYDTDTDTWLVDDDVFMARFPEGGIYDESGWRKSADQAESDLDWDIFITLTDLFSRLEQRVE